MTENKGSEQRDEMILARELSCTWEAYWEGRSDISNVLIDVALHVLAEELCEGDGGTENDRVG